MSTVGAFNKKNPTIKRILKEASELANSPSSDFHAEPLESDLFSWHFTIRGPPAPSPFAGGIYHGRISLPPTYPLKPPNFRFTTPTGRFEVNREICLSISGHHEETWQPAWGIRTALVAIRSFMDTEAKGQVGGLDMGKEGRERLARESVSHRCDICGKMNTEIMHEREEAIKEMGEAEASKQEEVPDELRLAYREELAQSTAGDTSAVARAVTPLATHEQEQPPPQVATMPAAQLQRQATPVTAAPLAPPPVAEAVGGIPAWIDKAIYGVAVALVFMIFRALARSA